MSNQKKEGGGIGGTGMVASSPIISGLSFMFAAFAMWVSIDLDFFITGRIIQFQQTTIPDFSPVLAPHHTILVLQVLGVFAWLKFRWDFA